MRVRKSFLVVLLTAAGAARAQRPARGGALAAPAGGALPRLESGAGARADPRRGAGGWSPWADAGWGAGEWWPVAGAYGLGAYGSGAYGSGWYGPSGWGTTSRLPRRRVRPLVIVVGGPILGAPAPAPAARARPAAGGGADHQAEGEPDDADDVPCDAPGADRCVDAVRRVGRTKVIEAGAARPPGAARDSAAARRRPPR